MPNYGQITGIQILNLTWEVPVGKTGTDDSEYNPLARALRSLFFDGSPFDAFSICLFGGEEATLQTGDHPKWLGVFIHSLGERIIFFPGLNISPDWIEIDRVTNSIPRRSFEFDHTSLEINRQRWHFTSQNSRNHLAGGRTPELGEGRLLWFWMSISDPSILRDLMRKTVIISPSPKSDSQRRYDQFLELETKASHHIVHLMNGAKARFPEGILHFRFVVGPKNSSDYLGQIWLPPSGSSYLIEPIPNTLQNIPIRLNRVQLSKHITVQITAF